MNQNVGCQLPAEPRIWSIIQQTQLDWNDFLLDPALIQDLTSRSTQHQFQLGDVIESYVPPLNEIEPPCDRSISLILQGQVRILCHSLALQRDVSAQLLKAGDLVGADHRFYPQALPYRAIAATGVEVLQIPATVLIAQLARYPESGDRIREFLQRRERLIFIKAYAQWPQESGKQTPTLTVQQIQKLLPYLRSTTIPRDTPLGQTEAINGLGWLRQGTIKSLSPDMSPPQMGCLWSRASNQLERWVAQSDLVIYHIAAADFEPVLAIAPELPLLIHSQGISLPPSSETPAITPILKPTHSVPTAIPAPASTSAIPAPQTASDTTDVVPFPKPRRFPRWRGRLWPKYPFIAQQSASDCGGACLAMVGQFWGKRFNLNTIRNWLAVNRTGASLKQMAATADRLGFHAQPVRASFGRLADRREPWIAHWQGEHFVVVYWMRGDRILIADPARGKQLLSKSAFLQHWSGYALLLDPTSRLQTLDTESSQSIAQFWGLLGSYPGILWQIILISLLIQLLGLVTPLLTQVILDQVVVHKSLSALHIFALGVVFFSVWRVVLVGVRQYWLDYLSNRLDLTLLSGFVGHALRLPLKFFEMRHVGDIITRIQENQKIQLFLVRQAISTWLDALMVFVYLGLMVYYNWQLALLVMTLIPPIVLLAIGATPFLKQLSREVFNAAAEQNSQVVEMMTGIATVKTSAAEQEMRWRWEDKLVGMLNVQFKAQKLANGLQVTSGLIHGLGSAALLWYGASLVIQDQLTIGQFVAFNLLIGNVITPIVAVVGVWDEFQEVLISVERLNDVFATAPEELPSQPMLELPSIQGHICFEDVCFSYDASAEHYTLQNLSFTVAAGQTIAIVGRSGSGKTTLIKLLQGLYHPDRGRVLIDGHDLRHVSPSSLRPQLGVVSQESFLFSGTILDNIQLYRSDYHLDQVIEVAKLAEAHGFIQDLPLGYNTKVGERGSNLSGGQRQRITIARALLADPPLLLLDEATSSLDSESERRFQQNLQRISRNRTTLIIAHRLSTVQHADRILVLDRGLLVEQGTHAELMQQRGLYCHLSQQQLSL